MVLLLVLSGPYYRTGGDQADFVFVIVLISFRGIFVLDRMGMGPFSRETLCR